MQAADILCILSILYTNTKAPQTICFINQMSGVLKLYV